MTIIEALQKSKKVRRKDGIWWDTTAVKYASLSTESVLATDWEAEPELLEGWINIYPNNNSWYLIPSREEADRMATNERIRCVKVREVRGE